VALSPVEKHSFKSVEQVDELTHALGWDTEYRQLKPGAFTSTFSVLEGDAWFLMEEQSSRRVEVGAPAPDGMFVLALAEGNATAVNGQALSRDHIFLQTPGSEVRATLSAAMKITQLGIEAEQLEEVMAVVAPDMSFPPGRVSTIATAPERLANLRLAMRDVLHNPPGREAVREEVVSQCLAETIVAAFDSGEDISGDILHRANAAGALNRAREYIESHLCETIRITSLCRYAQTNARSLERIFARELGMSPQQYVKARRLNAVRRSLLAAKPGQGLLVTDVALSHGFTHLGRFAGDYVRYFGEQPRETLLAG
jgi:AraC-like DNA-binding protein